MVKVKGQVEEEVLLSRDLILSVSGVEVEDITSQSVHPGKRELHQEDMEDNFQVQRKVSQKTTRRHSREPGD